MRGKKVGPALHTIRNGTCAQGVGEIDDSPAGRLVAAIARATGDELSGDLEFDEGKTVKPRKRRPFGAEIAERDGDCAVPQQPGDLLHQPQAANDVGCIELDDESIESRMVRYPSPQMFDQFRIPKEGHWQIDCDFD